MESLYCEHASGHLSRYKSVFIFILTHVICTSRVKRKAFLCDENGEGMLFSFLFARMDAYAYVPCTKQTPYLVPCKHAMSVLVVLNGIPPA